MVCACPSFTARLLVAHSMRMGFMFESMQFEKMNEVMLEKKF
jgi:hypothetical protein